MTGTAGDGGDDDRAWLLRLEFGDWMRAALHELEHAYRALAASQRRQGLTHARRAAGMGVNALLRVRFDAGFGRTYLEHVEAVAAGAGEAGEAPEAVRAAARRLVDAKEKVELVAIRRGRGNVELADDAKAVLVWLADRLPAE